MNKQTTNCILLKKKKVRIEVLDERFFAMHLGMLCKIFQGGIFLCSLQRSMNGLFMTYCMSASKNCKTKRYRTEGAVYLKAMSI